jgi:hypothetical protein
MLGLCGQNLSNSDSFDPPMRTAIAAVKAEASTSEKKKFGDPNSGKLNNNSYEYISRVCTP